MTPLHNIIRETIEKNGPISVATFMSMCLGHPQYGYYMNREAFGARGDFITAPEISQLFGEMIALWVILSWEQLGKPDEIQLIEMGPGRGTLMRDIWRGLSASPALQEKLQIHLVEFSPRLQKIQREMLEDLPLTWHQHLETVPQQTSLIVANEFFDALPIEQAFQHQGNWFKRVVTMDDEDLLFVVGPGLQGLPPQNLPDGTIYEYAPLAAQIMAELCQRLQSAKGAMLIIDYGDDVPLDRRFGDTLQSLRDHKPVDVLAAPGESDVTAHVSFASLKMIATENACATLPLQTQREFLAKFGIDIRLAKLAETAMPEQAAALKSGVHRLVDHDEMGDLFKVLQVFSHGV